MTTNDTVARVLTPSHMQTSAICVRQQVTEAVIRCFDHAEKQLDVDFRRPTVNFQQRGKIAGSARLICNELRFNPVLLEDNVELFLQEVVPHEVCHLLAHQLFGRVKPHGIEWKRLMKGLFGLSGKAYHSMDISRVQGRTFPYRCGCGTVELSVRRHNKVRRQEQIYQCRACGEVLQEQGKA